MCYGIKELSFTQLQYHQLSAVPALEARQAPEGDEGKQVSPLEAIVTGALGVAILCALIFGVVAMLRKQQRAAASRAGKDQVRPTIYHPFMCNFLFYALE